MEKSSIERSRPNRHFCLCRQVCRHYYHLCSIRTGLCSNLPTYRPKTLSPGSEEGLLDNLAAQDHFLLAATIHPALRDTLIGDTSLYTAGGALPQSAYKMMANNDIQDKCVPVMESRKRKGTSESRDRHSECHNPDLIASRH